MFKKLVKMYYGVKKQMCSLFKIILWSFPALPKIPKEMELSGNRELFSQILVLKLLYPDKDEWNNSFLVELNSIVEEYEHDISLKHIGFPQDWYVQLVK